MTRFSIPQAAFAGYRLLAARPGTALVWFIFQLAIALLTAFVTVSLAGPQLTALKEMMAAGKPDPATMMTLNAQMLPYTAFKSLFPLLTGTIAVAAVSRAFVRPKDSGLGYLRFGADELRVLVVYIVLMIIFAVPYIIATVVGMIALVSTAGPTAAMAVSTGAFGELPPKAIAFAVLSALPALALLIFLAVKLSLAPVQTVAERSIRIFNSWTLTKGHFWRILGAYVLAMIPLAVVGLVVMAAAMALKPDGFSGAWQQALAPDVSSMGAAFAGAAIIIFVLVAAFQTLVMAGQTGPGAAIYTALTGGVVADDFGDDDDDDEDDED